LQEDRLFEEPFDHLLSNERRRKRVIIEQDWKCNKCGISKCLINPISFEIDHIDGNNNNNDRKNLEALCPNCHSITDTWRGRNKLSRDYKQVTLEQLKDATW